MAPPSITDWAGLAVAGGGFIYAGLQLRAAKRAARGTFLLGVEDALRHYEGVHQQLDDEHEGPIWEPTGMEMSDVEAYMGVFERIQILVEQGSIDIETVDRLYSYRVINLTRNAHIVREKLEVKGEFWSDFYKLWRALEGCPYWRRNVTFLTNHDLPTPPEAPQPPAS